MAHIVIAEDDTAMRQFITTSLTRAGHDVTDFADGQTAFEYLSQADKVVDLLLTDIVMPGMDGVELATRSVAQRSGLRVMYITGFSTVSVPQFPGAATPAQVLAKPLHLSQLLAEVERQLQLPVPVAAQNT